MDLLDGPMGTELNRRGCSTDLPLWSAKALIDNPELIKQIYLDYIAAGVDIITTNTFRTQSYTFNKAKLDDMSVELTKKALEIAMEVKKEKGVKIAGSIAPIEDCYSPQLRPDNETLIAEFRQMGKILNDGIDIFLIETMNSFVEAKIAYEEVAVYGKKIWLSFTADSDGNILSGDSWEKVIGYFGDKVDIIGVNCSSLEGSDKAITRLIELGVDRWSVYPNFGTIDEEVGWSSEISENYINYLGKWIEMRPAMIGTCCGATPVESKILKEMISGIE